MPKIIDILLEEHQNIEKLLLVVEHELEVFDRGGGRTMKSCKPSSSIFRITRKAAIIPRKR